MRWTLAVLLAAGVGAPVAHAQSSQEEEAIVARTGEIVRVTWGPRRDSKTGQREVVAVTDFNRRPLPGYRDSAARRPLTWDVLSTEWMPTRPPGPRGGQARDMTQPANAKEGESGRGGLLVSGNAVHDPDRFLGPKLLFRASKGEIILAASRGVLTGGTVPKLGRSAEFVAVSTTAGVYVVSLAGDIQAKVGHLGGKDFGSVRVYRAPFAAGAVTYIWYGPGPWSPGARSSRAIEFRDGKLVNEIGFSPNRP